MYSLNGSVFSIKNAATKATIGYGSSQNRFVNFTNTGAGNISVGIGTDSPGGIFEVFQQSTGRTRGDLLVDAGAKYVYVGRLSTTSGDVSSFKVRDRLNRAYFDVNTASKYISFNPEVGDITMQIASGYGFKVNGGQFNVNATSGNVGIGTTSPGVKLHVSGDGALNATSTQSLLRLERPFNSGVSFAQGADIAIGRGNTYPSTQMRFILDNGTNSPANPQATVMALDSSGNVGIGTTSPGSKLVVAGGTDTAYNDGTLKVVGSIALNAANNLNPALNRWALRPRAAGVEGSFDIYDARNSLSRLTIVNSGNVGIGEASPTAKLEIYNSGGTVLNVTGSQGQLFSVTDDLSGSIFAVADISGVPIFDVNSSGLVTVDGPFAQTGGSNSNFSGNVILTTANADTILTIGTSASGGIDWDIQSASSSSPYAQSAGDLLFRNASSNVLILGNNGSATFAGNVRALGQSLFLSNSSVFNKIALNGTDMEIWSGALFPSIDITSAGLLKFGGVCFKRRWNTY